MTLAATLATVTPIHAARPPFKWAGGKTKLLPELRKHVPDRFGRYFEPFVGAGSLYFDLAPRKATLNDANPFVMAFYETVRDDLSSLVRALQFYVRGHTGSETSKERFYYEQRDRRPDPRNKAKAAAWFLFTNKTGYNGMYRVNQKGEFNIPHGKWKSPPTICNPIALRAVALALQGARLTCGDFEKSVKGATRGDFVYFDPPYWPKSASSDFTAYTKEPFGPAEQAMLRDLALNLKYKGVHVLLSNSDVAQVRKLYAKGFEKRVVKARRNINSVASDRGPVNELLLW
jgi:DNA adenine methylase